MRNRAKKGWKDIMAPPTKVRAPHEKTCPVCKLQYATTKPAQVCCSIACRGKLREKEKSKDQLALPFKEEMQKRAEAEWARGRAVMAEEKKKP